MRGLFAVHRAAYRPNKTHRIPSCRDLRRLTKQCVAAMLWPARRLTRQSRGHVTGNITHIRSYPKGSMVAMAPLRVAQGIRNKIPESLAKDRLIVANIARDEMDRMGAVERTRSN